MRRAESALWICPAANPSISQSSQASMICQVRIVLCSMSQVSPFLLRRIVDTRMFHGVCFTSNIFRAPYESHIPAFFVADTAYFLHCRCPGCPGCRVRAFRRNIPQLSHIPAWASHECAPCRLIHRNVPGSLSQSCLASSIQCRNQVQLPVGRKTRDACAVRHCAYARDVHARELTS